jgi:cytoskeletal protein CcmA (bactofilin family)
LRAFLRSASGDALAPPRASQLPKEENIVATFIGETIRVKGQMRADEDIRIAGRFEGEIQSSDHVVTVQPTAQVQAQVAAKAVVVGGSIDGDIVAADAIMLQNTAMVAGKISAPRIAINDGASFNGKIDTFAAKS